MNNYNYNYPGFDWKVKENKKLIDFVSSKYKLKKFSNNVINIILDYKKQLDSNIFIVDLLDYIFNYYFFINKKDFLIIYKNFVGDYNKCYNNIDLHHKLDKIYIRELSINYYYDIYLKEQIKYYKTLTFNQLNAEISNTIKLKNKKELINYIISSKYSYCHLIIVKSNFNDNEGIF